MVLASGLFLPRIFQPPFVTMLPRWNGRWPCFPPRVVANIMDVQNVGCSAGDPLSGQFRNVANPKVQQIQNVVAPPLWKLETDPPIVKDMPIRTRFEPLWSLSQRDPRNILGPRISNLDSYRHWHCGSWLLGECRNSKRSTNPRCCHMA
jgi:hypothetical protein